MCYGRGMGTVAERLLVRAPLGCWRSSGAALNSGRHNVDREGDDGPVAVVGEAVGAGARAVGAFAEEVFDAVARNDQRDGGSVYLRGLMLDGGARASSRWLRGWRTVTSSACSSSSISRRGGGSRFASIWRVRMGDEIEPQAWVVDDTGFPKRADARSASRGSIGRVGPGRQLPDRGVDHRRPRCRRRARSTGGCSCPRHGTSDARRAAPGRTCPRRSVTRRSGSSRWR